MKHFCRIKKIYSVQQIKMFNDVLFHPNVRNGKFDEQTFAIKKKELKDAFDCSK